MGRDLRGRPVSCGGGVGRTPRSGLTPGHGGSRPPASTRLGSACGKSWRWRLPWTARLGASSTTGGAERPFSAARRRRPSYSSASQKASPHASHPASKVRARSGSAYSRSARAARSATSRRTSTSWCSGPSSSRGSTPRSSGSGLPRAERATERFRSAFVSRTRHPGLIARSRRCVRGEAQAGVTRRLGGRNPSPTAVSNPADPEVEQRPRPAVELHPEVLALPADRQDGGGVAAPRRRSTTASRRGTRSGRGRRPRRRCAGRAGHARRDAARSLRPGSSGTRSRLRQAPASPPARIVGPPREARRHGPAAVPPPLRRAASAPAALHLPRLRHQPLARREALRLRARLPGPAAAGASRHEPWRGAWDVPGGSAGRASTPPTPPQREVREETGLVPGGGVLGMWIDTHALEGPTPIRSPSTSTFMRRLTAGRDGDRPERGRGDRMVCGGRAAGRTGLPGARPEVLRAWRESRARARPPDTPAAPHELPRKPEPIV